MTRARLDSNQKDVLKKSDREMVRVALRRLPMYMKQKRWLGTKNAYRGGQPGAQLNHKHLGEFIAASAPLHCADGWALLGRALDCHARGDADGARHLGYYAELRGAMSLLAAEGIGVFDSKHAVLESSGTCLKLPGRRVPRTHLITWLALKHWAGLKRSADLLADVIEPGGVPLSEWLDAFQGVAGAWHPIGDRWLRTWGLDLQRMAKDQKARNVASYRPSHVDPGPCLPVLDCSGFVRDLWEICEPSSVSRFELLDRHLLRLGLEAAFKGITGKKASDDCSSYEGRVRAMLGAVAPEGPLVEELERFLTRDSQPEDPSLTSEASGVLAANHPRHHVQVMSRAALLLRFATGACAAMLRHADLARNDLEFWWKALGEERRLWDPGGEPEELVDLWADVESALRGVREWEVAANEGGASQAEWRRECSQEISVLGECERIALWGLGL